MQVRRNIVKLALDSSTSFIPLLFFIAAFFFLIVLGLSKKYSCTIIRPKQISEGRAVGRTNWIMLPT